jgi:hypothetical protein
MCYPAHSHRRGERPGVTDFTPDGKPLAIGRRQGPTAPTLGQGLTILAVDQRRDRRLQGFLTQIPRTGPRQAIIREIGTVGHLDESHVGALGHDRGIQVQQEVIGTRLAASRTRDIVTKACPLVDFEQYIRQVDVG